MEDLTKRQREIIEFIVQYTFEHLYQPTFKEIAERCSLASMNAVNDHLKALRRKGYLGEAGQGGRMRAFELKDRALRLVKPTHKLRAQPLFGLGVSREVPGY
jgi:SOS-response transcriptional repressor LexA